MDKLKDMDYVFWLDIWRDGSEILPKAGHFKCIVTKNKIHVTADDNDSDKELNIDISAIKSCKLGYDAGTRSRIVQLFLDNKKFF